ncbi:MAG: hypothetical protein EA427_05815 [Spirochaetaceae bacterium]|nr:MAG: hypothetical protein EA427_05815 [Spirochaetaceae bacterium]
MQPKYVSFESKEREELLSQIGNFSPGERDVFHKLCQNWQEEIPYERFTRLLSGGEGGTAADLTSLMTKLRKDGWGILRTRTAEGSREKRGIILTEQNSTEFFSALLDEFFLDMLESIVNPLPLASMIEKVHGPVPRDVLQPVEPAELPAIMTADEPGEEQPEGKPLSIQSLNSDALLITRGNLRTFMNVAILKMRYYLSNTTLLGLLAKLQNTSLLALKKGCAGKDIPFWLGLTRSVVSHTKEIESLRNVSVDANFYHVAWLLKNMIESQLTGAEEKKKRQEEENLDLEAIALAVKDAPEGLIDQVGLTRIIESQSEKYDDRMEEFREKFYQRFVREKGGAKLPKIVMLGQRYIHRDNIFPLFMEKFRVAEADLKPYFVHLMEQHLRTGNRRQDQTFFSTGSFEDAILEQVRQRSTFLAEIIGKPGILAEGMIHHLKQNKLVKDVEELRQRLALYFDPETMKPLPLHQWFNLRLVDIFERAFERLPVWQRIWIRITGKYESFRGRFISRDVMKATTPGESGLTGKGRASADKRAGGRKSGQDSSREQSGAKRRKNAAEGAPYRRKGPASGGAQPKSAQASATGAAKRAYNSKQVDSAWEQFGSSIKKN